MDELQASLLISAPDPTRLFRLCSAARSFPSVTRWASDARCSGPRTMSLTQRLTDYRETPSRCSISFKERPSAHGVELVFSLCFHIRQRDEIVGRRESGRRESNPRQQVGNLRFYH